MKVLCAIVLAMVFGWLPVRSAMAEAPAEKPAAEPAAEPTPTTFDEFDAAFGKYIVGPLATVMFWDTFFWDNTLPLGELPSSETGAPAMVGESEVVEYRSDEGYVFKAVRMAAPDALVVHPDADEEIELSPGRMAKVGELDGALEATTGPGTVPLAPCESFETCGSSIAEPKINDRGELVLDAFRVPSPGDPSLLRVLDDRGPHPLVVQQGEGDMLTVLGAIHPVERAVLKLQTGRTVSLDDARWEVLSIDAKGAVQLRSVAEDVKDEVLDNPGNIQVPLVVAWLVFGAVFFTIRMQFINLRGFAHAIWVTAGKYDEPDEHGDISHFQALSSALSATVGLGNIAGVAIAVAAGGPGAIPWMIVAGFLGMSSKFTECTLGQMYRSTDSKGNVSGGPMHYLYDGLVELKLAPLGKFLAVLFALMCIGGSLGGGNMFQSNQAFVAVAGQVEFFADKAWLFGLLMSVLVGVVILGGIKRIGSIAGVIVPVMCGVYVLAALYILMVHASAVPEAFATMFRSAFTLEAGLGGLIGALIQGFRRAAFSNEAGVGSASIAHSAATTSEPVREGIVALLEPFIDTIVVCTMTGLVVVITGAYQSGAGDGVEMTAEAFRSVLPWFPSVLSVAVVLFAFSTMISWSYYGERCAVHLFGEWASLPYKLLFCVATFVGAVLKLGSVLDFSDLMVLGMAFPNILGLLLLSGKVKARLDDYWGRLQSGEMKRVA
jgi:AGCS family alanine or glycine:cation symporter